VNKPINRKNFKRKSSLGAGLGEHSTITAEESGDQKSRRSLTFVREKEKGKKRTKFLTAGGAWNIVKGKQGAKR